MGRRERARALRPRSEADEQRADEVASRLEAARSLDPEAQAAAIARAATEPSRDALRWLMFERPELARAAARALAALGPDVDTGHDLEALLRCRIDPRTWESAAEALMAAAPERAREAARRSPGSKLARWMAASRAARDTDPAPAPAPVPESAPSPKPEPAPVRDEWLFATHERASLLRWALALEAFRFVRADPRDPSSHRDRLALALALDGTGPLGRLAEGPWSLLGEPVRVVLGADRWLLEVDDGGRVTDADFARALRLEQRMPLDRLTLLDPPVESPFCVSRATRPDLFH